MTTKPGSFYGPDDPSVSHILLIVGIGLAIAWGISAWQRSSRPNTIEEASRVLSTPLDPRQRPD